MAFAALTEVCALGVPSSLFYFIYLFLGGGGAGGGGHLVVVVALTCFINCTKKGVGIADDHSSLGVTLDLCILFSMRLICLLP